MRQCRFVVCLLLSAAGWAQQNSATSLTIYNQDFAVVRDSVRLQLNSGVNPISYDDITSYVEPDSVVLRDPAGRVNISILDRTTAPTWPRSRTCCAPMRVRKFSSRRRPASCPARSSVPAERAMLPVAMVATVATPARPLSRWTAKYSLVCPVRRFFPRCRTRRC